MKCANELGLWDLLQTIILIASAIIGVKLIFFPRKRIRKLDFWPTLEPAHPQFGHCAKLNIQNYTGCSVIISSPYFRYKKIPPHEHAAQHAPSGDYQLKFPSPSGSALTEVEFLLRNKESTYALIFFADQTTEDEIREAIKERGLGRLECNVTWLRDKPHTEKLIQQI